MYLVGAPHPNRERLEAFLRHWPDEDYVTSAEVHQEIMHRFVAIDRRAAIEDAFIMSGVDMQGMPRGMVGEPSVVQSEEGLTRKCTLPDSAAREANSAERRRSARILPARHRRRESSDCGDRNPVQNSRLSKLLVSGTLSGIYFAASDIEPYRQVN